jgi:hypothetical protein
MSRNFTVTGAEALLAIAACERTTSLAGKAETRPGQNVTFAYGAIGRLLPFEISSQSSVDAPEVNLSVEVERLMTRPGVYRYQCVIQPNVNGILN